jgi:K+-transporting ATPase ATPase C chain
MPGPSPYRLFPVRSSSGVFVTHKGADGKDVSTIEPVREGSDVQSVFFDMWRQEHAEAGLQDLPGDMVTTSGSGLDPHITLQNAVAARTTQDS